MAVVVDANLLVALATDDVRAPAITSMLQGWSNAREDLHAPELLRYEVASALMQLVAAGAFPADRLGVAWRAVADVLINYHPLRTDAEQVISIALRLGRKSAYDAAYIALADQLGAELWTFDGPLARNASGLGFPVRLVR